MTTFRITAAGRSKQTWSSRAERTAYRLANQICVACGLDLEDEEVRLCDDCKARAAKRQKKYRKKHPESTGYALIKADRKANPEKYRKARVARYERDKLGQTCTKCSAPAAEDSNNCVKHRDLSRTHSLNYWKKKGDAKRRARRAA